MYEHLRSFIASNLESSIGPYRPPFTRPALISDPEMLHHPVPLVPSEVHYRSSMPSPLLNPRPGSGRSRRPRPHHIGVVFRPDGVATPKELLLARPFGYEEDVAAPLFDKRRTVDDGPYTPSRHERRRPQEPPPPTPVPHAFCRAGQIGPVRCGRRLPSVVTTPKWLMVERRRNGGLDGAPASGYLAAGAVVAEGQAVPKQLRTPLPEALPGRTMMAVEQPAQVQVVSVPFGRASPTSDPSSSIRRLDPCWDLRSHNPPTLAAGAARPARASGGPPSVGHWSRPRTASWSSGRCHPQTRRAPEPGQSTSEQDATTGLLGLVHREIDLADGWRSKGSWRSS
jgi:hypothetical protein